MRKVIEEQLQFGEVDISSIKLNPKCRDDITKILYGLQHIYCDDDLRERVFKILESEIANDVDKDNGRPGMYMWKIFVLAMIRLGLNIDYDRLHNLANNHLEIRMFLGHGFYDTEEKYHSQTIKDNVGLLTEGALYKISELVVKAGHKYIKKKKHY